MTRILVAAFVALALLISGRQFAVGAEAAAYKSVLIEGVPHVRQKSDFCGEACAAMFLNKLGRPVDQDFVFDQSGLDPLLGRGCYTYELAKALWRIGFRIGPVWHRVSVARSADEMEAQFHTMHADLAEGIPSIVCMHYDDEPKSSEHFRLILGYDASSDEVIYHEPAVARGAYKRMKRDELLKLWALKYDEDEWTVVRIRLEPGRLINGRAATEFTDADYAQHIRELKKKLPSEDFHIVLEKPFVVIGDESPEVVEQRAATTIRWAVDRIKRVYFTKDPHDILDIWLFKDKESYEENAEKLFGKKPTTKFGYYSPRHKSLVMNISTGGGTLVHEIVHPFIAANFPDCPSWFNEGLASLYEACQDNNGHIWGMTNWRLSGLQKAILDEEVPLPTFKELCSTTTSEFYDNAGPYYAQARYLCYYLQQHGLLNRYYHEFRRSVDDDPTGYDTLVRLLDEEDMDAFQKKWQEYVMRLQQ